MKLAAENLLVFNYRSQTQVQDSGFFFQWLQVYFLKKIMNLLPGTLPLALLAEIIYILTEIICLFQNGPSYKIMCILHVQGSVFS